MKRYFTLLITVVAVGIVLSGCSSDQSPLGPDDTPFIGTKPLNEEVARVIGIQNLHTDQLMANPNIVGVATGIGTDGTASILVLTNARGVAGLPEILDGVTVVVKRTGNIQAMQAVDPTARFPRPVPIGVSAGHPDITAGTIGCRVKDAQGNVYALSNNHVFADENAASIGDDVLQPGTYDGGSVSTDVIGTLYDFEPIISGRGSNKIDAAIALTSINDVSNTTPANGYGTPEKGTVSASIGLAVQKYGRTTALTKGTITGINASTKVRYDSGIVKFSDQIIVESSTVFIQGGDSGSLLVTEPGRNPVGLLFAGNSSGTLAIANRIDLVLARFNVTIDGGTSPPPSTPTGSISGQVTDDTGSPVVGTTVTDGTRSTTSDGSGRYTIVEVPDGTYNVTASATGYNNLSQSANVAGGGPTSGVDFALTAMPVIQMLNVTVSTDKASYVNRETARIIVDVTDGITPVEGAAVNVTITTAKGNRLGGSSSTNAQGVATITYKVNSKRDGVGTYTTVATASKTGASGEDTTTFEVQ